MGGQDVPDFSQSSARRWCGTGGGLTAGRQALVVFKAPGPSFLDRFAEEAVTLEKPLPPASASVPMHPLYGALGTPRRQGSPGAGKRVRDGRRAC